MKNVNATAAEFAAFEALAHMVKEAKGAMTAEQIMTEIVANPAGETAKYFEAFLKTGYNTIMEVANEK